MCGIAGLAGPEPDRERRARVRRMVAEIVHRGPDDDGFGGDPEGRVALGMRRLSIIDLPGGGQPIRSSDGVEIVYNGEVYNYRALREELERHGRRFSTHSDTEVVLEAYRAWGIGALERLQGMFGVCLHDPDRRELHLARDRLGVKPLYYTVENGELAFASEIKALLAGLDRRPELNRQAIHDYLTLRYVPGPDTVWQGIRKLQPGHRLRYALDGGEARVEPWWRLEFDSQPEEAGRDYAGEFERLFCEAVSKRLLAADVPVGVLLSGGIDSSAVSAAAVELGHRDFHTFSVGFAEGGEWSELEHARALARHIGSRHHEIEVDRDSFLGFLPELVHSTDEPLADLASIPLDYVSRLAREEVKVVLSGEGADEVLAGYNLDETAAALHRWRRVAALPRPLLGLAARLAPAERAEWLPVIAEHGWSEALRATRAHMTWVFDERDKKALWRAPEDLRPTTELLDSWYAEARSPEPLDQLQQVYCGSWLVEDLLMKADKMTMRNSLELRVPFLDHALVEWAARAPLAVKVGDTRNGWRSKRVLREFAERRVPAEIVSRPKRGFPVPAYDWLAGPLGGWGRERLAAGGPLDELFEMSALEPALAGAAAGDVGSAHKVWTMIVLGEWAERWL